MTDGDSVQEVAIREGTGEDLEMHQAATSQEEMRQELRAELDELTQRVQSVSPQYEPPPFSPKGLVVLIGDTLTRFPREVQLDALEWLRGTLGQDTFDPEVWKGIWYVANYSLQYNVDLVRRRFVGEYDTDAWGLDWEFVDLLLPFFRFLIVSLLSVAGR